MVACEGCGKDHEQEWRDYLPEWALIDEAFEWTKTTRLEEILSPATIEYMKLECQSGAGDHITQLLYKGVPAPDVAGVFATKMMLTGFIMGVALAHTIDDEKIPEVQISEFDRQKFVEAHWDDLNKRDELPSSDEVLRVLQDRGILPEDFEGKIEVLGVTRIPESEGGGEPTTGMYL